MSENANQFHRIVITIPYTCTGLELDSQGTVMPDRDVWRNIVNRISIKNRQLEEIFKFISATLCSGATVFTFFKTNWFVFPCLNCTKKLPKIETRSILLTCLPLNSNCLAQFLNDPIILPQNPINVLCSILPKINTFQGIKTFVKSLKYDFLVKIALLITVLQ